MGEFGRTPQVNGNNGRDHWPNGWSVALAGGGVGAGRVIGSTGEDGMEIRKDPVTVPDLFATICALCGIDPGKRYLSHTTGIVKATDGGRPVSAVYE